MPTTPTLILCDDLVAALVAAWEPEGDDGAERAYFKRFGDGQAIYSKLKGRRVVIFPTGYTNEPADRGTDEFEHRVSVQILERYVPDGDPTTEWTDERVDWVYEMIAEGFDYGREVPAWNPRLWTKSADVVVCDIDTLVTGGKVFLSQVDFVFGEHRDA
jgi:hypothetical protein